MAASSRVFNALNGKEVRKIILAEIEQAFAGVHEFTTEALTLPVCRWSWKCDIDVFPREPARIALEKTGSIVSPDATEAEAKNTVTISLEGVNAAGAPGMAAPDELREEHGLPVPTLTTDRRSGASFDRLVQPEPIAVEGPKVRGAVLDRGGPGRVK